MQHKTARETKTTIHQGQYLMNRTCLQARRSITAYNESPYDLASTRLLLRDELFITFLPCHTSLSIEQTLNPWILYLRRTQQPNTGLDLLPQPKLRVYYPHRVLHVLPVHHQRDIVLR